VKAAAQVEDFPASNVRGTLWSIRIPIHAGVLLVEPAVTMSTASRLTESGFLRNSEAAVFEGQKSSLSELVSSLSFGYLSRDVAQIQKRRSVG
jgi:hypothetical protein